MEVLVVLSKPIGTKLTLKTETDLRISNFLLGEKANSGLVPKAAKAKTFKQVLTGGPSGTWIKKVVYGNNTLHVLMRNH